MLRFLLFTLLVSPLFAADTTAPSNLNLVYLGDSITACTYLHQPTTGTPPAICTAQIQTGLKDTLVYFSNQGHSGHTTLDFLPDSGKDFPEAENAARKLQQDHPGKLVFSIMLGTNDSAVQGPHGSPVSPADYGKNLTAIIDRLLTDFPGTQIFIQQPTYYTPNTHNAAIYDQAGLDRLNSYFPVIQATVTAGATAHPGQVHAGDTAAYAYFQQNYLTESKPEQGKEGTFYLHPNAIGAATLGKFWATAILAGLTQTP